MNLTLVPEALRVALYWVALTGFVLAQGALLARAVAELRAAPPALPRLGRRAELVMSLVPAALTAALFLLAWWAVVGVE